MRTLDDQIRLAEQIADSLPEVTRNEWMRWMRVADEYGLEKAVHYAERLSTDTTMRPSIQRANRLIAQAVKFQMSTLQRLGPKERKTVLGYVGWWLQIKTLRGSLRTKGEE